jgi:hypothetical protein
VSQVQASRWTRFREGLRHAFALEGPHGPLTDEDHQVLAKLADLVVDRRMATPALLFLNSIRPLNAIGSQAMVFLRPFLTPLFKPADYDRVTKILERREGIAALVEAIEAAEGL